MVVLYLIIVSNNSGFDEFVILAQQNNLHLGSVSWLCVADRLSPKWPNMDVSWVVIGQKMWFLSEKKMTGSA